MSDTDHWCSPPEIAEPLAEFFGGPVDCDPCTNATSIIQARVNYTWGGLHRPWGKTTYENPPYSKTGPWFEKARREMDEALRVKELVALVMSVPSVLWWRRACGAFRINPRVIITTRLCFIDPQAPAKQRRQNARFDTALFYYGASARRVAAFEREFRHVTSWVAWGRSGARA